MAIPKISNRWIMHLASLASLAVMLLPSLPGARPARAAPPPQPAPRAAAQTTLTVTSPADSGPGTLRWALESATISDTIIFDPAVFPPANPATIALTSTLPDIIADRLTIDGSNAGVILDGSGIGTFDSGLLISNAVSVTIQGLQILHFPYAGIALRGAQDCLIGGDRAVGAGPLGQGNLISDNWYGVHLKLYQSRENTISGNYIGTDATGTQPLGNTFGGVYISSGSSNLIGGETPGRGNLVSGNGGRGVFVTGVENVISGNYIGTDATGTQPLGNGEDGIEIRGSGNLVGGDTLAAGNRIAFNEASGILVCGATENRISHNAIFQNTRWGIENSEGGNEELPPRRCVRGRGTPSSAPPRRTVWSRSARTRRTRGNSSRAVLWPTPTGRLPLPRPAASPARR